MHNPEKTSADYLEWAYVQKLEAERDALRKATEAALSHLGDDGDWMIAGEILNDALDSFPNAHEA